MPNDKPSALTASCLEALSRMLEGGGLGCVFLEGAGVVLRANSAAAGMLGQDDDESMVGRPLLALLPDEAEARPPDLLAAMKDCTAADFRLEPGDRVLDCSATPLVVGDGQTALALVLRDVTEACRNDEQLRRERQRHIFLMEALPGFLLLIGEDNAVHYANRKTRKLFGRSVVGTVADALFRECATQNGFKAVPCPTVAQMRGEQPQQWEWRGPDGRCYQLYSHSMTEADATLSVIIHGLDITARKRAELELQHAHDELELRVQKRTAQLQESESRFRAVVEDQTELICRFTADRVIYFVNGAFFRFFGRSRKDLIGMQFLPGIVEEDRWMLEGFFDPIVPGKPARTLEFRVKSGVSAMCWLRWSIRGIYDAGGRLLEYQAVGRDVTGLRNAERRYFNLIQNLPVIAFALDYEFQLSFINDACAAIVGYTSKEAMDSPNWFFGNVLEEDRDVVRQVMYSYPLQESGDTPSVEFRFRHKKGYLVNLMARSIPPGKRPSSGAFDRVEGVIMDVTERMMLHKVLVQREKLNTLGAMSDELAHEIRNPLFALGGFARRLKSKHPELKEAEIILEQAQRLEQLLDRIRKYLEPVSTIRKLCKLDVLLNFTADMQAQNLEKYGASLEMEPGAGMVEVQSDPEVLAQVFVNLITNGMVAIERGGKIVVKIYETRQHVAVDFCLSPLKDHLGGEEQLLLPFEPQDQEGGVNLAVSYRLLKSVDGYLDFKQDGDSASFTVLLPKQGMAAAAHY